LEPKEIRDPLELEEEAEEVEGVVGEGEEES